MDEGIPRYDHIGTAGCCQSCNARVPQRLISQCGRCGINLCHWCRSAYCRCCGWNWAPPQRIVCDGGGERGMDDG
jgi:hypothetical protein